MATINHIRFLSANRNSIAEPVLIVGSKQYEFDQENLKTHLGKLGFNDVKGIDISEGDGVDEIADITESNSAFVSKYRNSFSTIICMEVLTHVRNPFHAADAMVSMLKDKGVIILSECYVRKISKMPVDYWRFTYEGTKQLFSSLKFDDTKAMISFTRDKSGQLMPLEYPLPQILAEKHPDESAMGFLVRRIHRRFFSKGIFRLSRLFPETTIYSIAVKNPN